jgi:ferredoxin
MKRQIIRIDENACNGCGLCVNACHEGAIALVDGKAKLVRDDFCDGLGNCLPACPTGAITFEEREAAAYDEAAVLARKAAKESGADSEHAATGAHFAPTSPAAHGGHGGCPGSRARTFARAAAADGPSTTSPSANAGTPASAESELRQWPVQIKLVPVNAPYFDGADLLVAADCAAYAYARFHEDFIKGKITIIGCPKLDAGDYTEKLTAIIAENDIKSLTIVRMEVPCCGGLAHAATEALRASGKFIPWQIVTISTDGKKL